MGAAPLPVPPARTNICSRTSVGDADVACTPTSAESFVLKRKCPGRATGIRASPGSAGASHAFQTSSGTPLRAHSLSAAGRAPSQPGPPRTSPRLGHIDAASLAIIRVMCLAARQLLSLVDASPKWINVWIVLEAGDGSVTSSFSGKVINCTVDKEEPARGGDFCKDWWAFRGSKEGRHREAKAAAADSKGSDNNSDAAGAGGGSGSRDGDGAKPCGEGKFGGRRPKSGASDDEAGDAASSGSTMYPPHEFLTRVMVKTAVRGKMGKRSLLAEDLRKLLYLGGLEDIGQNTYGDVADIFTSAGNVLRSRCGKKDFSWAGACPLSLLVSVWSTAGIKDVVDGTDFVPPHHRSAKGQSMQKKRLVLCVAAHLSPFYATVFEQHFVAVRASGRKKRFMAKDPFADSKKQAKKIRKREGKGNGGKLTKEEQLAAAASARLRLEKALRAAEAAKNESAAVKAAAIAAAERRKAAADAAAAVGADAIAAARAKAAADAAPAARPAGAGAGGSERGPMSPAASMPLCALEWLSENVRMHAVRTRELSPVLPDTTALSAVALSGQALSDAARASPSVRVVLPRVLLEKAFAALSAEQGNAATLPVDAPGPTEGGELAVRLTLSRYDPVVAFSTTLMQMSSALAFNEAIE